VTTPAPEYPQQSAQQPAQAPRKRRVWPWVLLGVFVVIIAMFVGCAALFGSAVSSVDKQMNTPVQVAYDVTGTAKTAHITYSVWQNGNSSMAQESDATLPWHKSVTSSGFAKGGDLTVTLDEKGGSVTCTVTIPGRAPITSTASGPFATASCTGF